MPTPALLRTRAVDAIAAGDWQAFDRWVAHPRWHLTHGQAVPLLRAAASTAQPVAWLERLAALGVNPASSGLDEPILHLAARRGDAATVAWLLAQGASPTARSSYGMGSSAAEIALMEGHSPVVAALWRAHGSLWALAQVSHRVERWVAATALPVLEHMATVGWCPLREEPAPDSHVAPWQSFLAWTRQQPSVDPAVLAWLASKSLEQRLPGTATPAPRTRL